MRGDGHGWKDREFSVEKKDFWMGLRLFINSSEFPRRQVLLDQHSTRLWEPPPQESPGYHGYWYEGKLSDLFPACRIFLGVW